MWDERTLEGCRFAREFRKKEKSRWKVWEDKKATLIRHQRSKHGKRWKNTAASIKSIA